MIAIECDGALEARRFVAYLKANEHAGRAEGRKVEILTVDTPQAASHLYLTFKAQPRLVRSPGARGPLSPRRRGQP